MTTQTKMSPINFLLLNLYGLSLTASDPVREQLGEKIAGQTFTQAEKEAATEALKKAGYLDQWAGITGMGLQAAQNILAVGEAVQEVAGPAAAPVADLGTVLEGQIGALGKMTPHRLVTLKAYEATLHEGHPDRARIAVMTQGQTLSDQESRFAVNSLQASYVLDREGRITEAGRAQARSYLQGLS